MFNIQKINKVSNICINIVRGTARYNVKHNKSKLYKEGDSVKIENFIRYYPKFNDDKKIEEIKSTEPPKLFRVHRIKKIAGNPFYEKRILRDFGLFEKGAVAIVKNIPENNSRLWKIKHLIKIEPIVFPYGEPSKDDINYSFLKENGDCVVIKNINVNALEERIKAADRFDKDQKQLDGEVLRRDTRLKWLNNY